MACTWHAATEPFVGTSPARLRRPARMIGALVGWRPLRASPLRTPVQDQDDGGHDHHGSAQHNPSQTGAFPVVPPLRCEARRAGSGLGPWRSRCAAPWAMWAAHVAGLGAVGAGRVGARHGRGVCFDPRRLTIQMPTVLRESNRSDSPHAMLVWVDGPTKPVHRIGPPFARSRSPIAFLTGW